MHNVDGEGQDRDPSQSEFSFWLFKKNYFIYLFLERGEGRAALMC